jgi:hypothetical protein
LETQVFQLDNQRVAIFCREEDIEEVAEVIDEFL